MKMKLLVVISFFGLLLTASAQSWIQGTWNVRVMSIDPGENEVDFFDSSAAITVSHLTGEQFTLTTPSDDGPESSVFSFDESDGLIEARTQGVDGQTTDFELFRAFRITEDLVFFTLLSFGGNGASLGPIYYTDPVAGIMSKGALPAIPSTAGLQGEYRGFSFGVDILSGDGFQPWTEVLEASVFASGSKAYTIDPNDGDGPETVSRQSNYLRLVDFSEHNVNSTGDFEAFLAFPITATEVVFL